jgi:hypothetical protein
MPEKEGEMCGVTRREMMTCEMEGGIFTTRIVRPMLRAPSLISPLANKYESTGRMRIRAAFAARGCRPPVKRN